MAEEGCASLARPIFSSGEGEHTAAQAFLEESLDLQKELQDRWGSAQSLAVLAKAKAYQGDNAGAGALYQQSLDILGDVGDRQLIATCLEGMAATVLSPADTRTRQQNGKSSPGEVYWAVHLLGAAEQLRKTIGAPLLPVELATYKRLLNATRAQLGDAPLKMALREGQNMLSKGLSRAVVTRLIQDPGIMSTEATYPAGLTQREVDVLRLVAQGMTDAQVATKLVLSTRTVGTHLRSIYHKLGVSTRSASTRFAVEHHLL